MPIYFQLARLVKDQIIHGSLETGSRLPSEPDIGETYGVSRSTVRQAFQRLENEGILERVKGRGTFVTARRQPSWLLQSSNGFFHDEVDRLHANVRSKLLRAEMATLPHWATRALNLSQETMGVTLERLRYVDERVATYVCDYLPPEFGPTALTIGNDGESLYELLETKDHTVVYGARRNLEAVHVDARIAAMLEVGTKTPVLFIESVAWDVDTKPFHCYQSWLRTDRVNIEIEVSRESSLPPIDGSYS